MSFRFSSLFLSFVFAFFQIGLIVADDANVKPYDALKQHHKAFMDALGIPHDLTVVPNSKLRGQNGQLPGPPPGWLYANAYVEPNCGGATNFTAGILTNTCLAPKGGSNTNPISILITCTGGKGLSLLFRSKPIIIIDVIY
jgi:hypothetical protein